MGEFGARLTLAGLVILGCARTPAPVDYKSPASHSISLKGGATVVVKSTWVEKQKGGVAQGQNFVVTVIGAKGEHPMGKGFLAGRAPLGAEAGIVGNELVVRLFNADSKGSGQGVTIRAPIQDW